MAVTLHLLRSPGVWIAHGSGSADRETADAQGHVHVPPGEESYLLRRVWLSAEEVSGYYYGFANEGLWPLCHNADTRPIFRSEDWKHYQRVNQKFADVVSEEADIDDPIVLVQDYHFALAPRLIRERLPKATVISFWHLPWPNPDRFGICPWRNEVLGGLLGSSIVGFQTRVDCGNFIDAIDRYRQLNASVEGLAARINERFGRGAYRPIVLLRTHHQPPTVFMHYRAADLCYVSSLHDGMKLVAKEFVAARDDERGVLVLSQFTGVARELTEALIVNPYDLDEAASALAVALEMPPDEQRARMRSMRSYMAEFNVYRWAGRMLVEAARLRDRERLAGSFVNVGGAPPSGSSG